MTFGRLLGVIFGFLLILIGGGCTLVISAELLSAPREGVPMVPLLALSVVTAGIGFLIVKWARGPSAPQPPADQA